MRLLAAVLFAGLVPTASGLAVGTGRAVKGPWPAAYPAKETCSRCGLCDTSFVSEVKDSCAFLGPGNSRIETLEKEVHGRSRAYSADDLDQAHFGVYESLFLAKAVPAVPGAQWTGICTTIAQQALRDGLVDAVVVVAGGRDGDPLAPRPVICRTPEEVSQGSGVKPSLCPSLAILDDVRADPTIKRLLFCGVGCSVQALRAIPDVEASLGLDELLVLGTHCVDNSPTVAATRDFLEAIPGGNRPPEGEYAAYEFMADYKVHIKRADGSYAKVPYFSLPGTIAEPSIAKSCLSCYDYVNGLADIVVGYMGAPLADGVPMTAQEQQVTVRNANGAKLWAAAERAGRVRVTEPAPTSTGSREKFVQSTTVADSFVIALKGDPVRTQGLPRLVGEFIAFLLGRSAPKGLEFAKYSIDYHFLRNDLITRRARGAAAADLHTPAFAKAIMGRYDEWMDPLREETAEEKETSV